MATDTSAPRLKAPAAYQAARMAGAGPHTLGWRLDRADREALLERLPPRYSHADVDHVTLATRVGAETPLPAETEGRIIGRADDGGGVETMVVEIGGTIDRPDGSTYHITWSLDRDRGREPVESNDVIRDCGWQPLEEPITVQLEPVIWGRG